jgi:hypothetical protein
MYVLLSPLDFTLVLSRKSFATLSAHSLQYGSSQALRTGLTGCKKTLRSRRRSLRETGRY